MHIFDTEMKNCMLKLGIMEKRMCTEEETKEFRKLKKDNIPLPGDVYYNDEGFFHLIKVDVSQEEINTYLAYKQTLYFKTMKNSLLAIAIVMCISFAISMLILFSGIL